MVTSVKRLAALNHTPSRAAKRFLSCWSRSTSTCSLCWQSTFQGSSWWRCCPPDPRVCSRCCVVQPAFLVCVCRSSFGVSEAYSEGVIVVPQLVSNTAIQRNTVRIHRLIMRIHPLKVAFHHHYTSLNGARHKSAAAANFSTHGNSA